MSDYPYRILSGEHPTHELVRGMETLIMAIQELSLARELHQITKIVRRVARELTGAEGATFVLREDGKCYYVDEDAIAPLWKGKKFPMESCISGWAMLNKKIVSIEDIYQDSRIPQDAYRPTFVKSLVMIPIRKESPIGAIGNYWASHHIATKTEIVLLQALADSTSIALENVELYKNLNTNIDELAEQKEKYRHLYEKQQSLTIEKDILLKEVYHRVKNNMQVVVSLLNLQMSDVDDPSSKMMLEESIKRISVMKLVHEMLYQSDDKSNIGLSDYISNLIEYVRKTNNNNDIIIHQTIQDVSVSINVAIPIGLILNELMTNALKYGFPDKSRGNITIESTLKDNHVLLKISDDGIGFDFEKTTSSLGLKMVKGLVGQVDGAIQIDSTNGTCIEITIPL